jgi:hypothetical protein
MASRQVFANACIELYARLWAELDLLSCGEDGEPEYTRQAAAQRSEILRLEIHLLGTACDTPRWRLLLDVSQRLALKSVLRDLLAFDDDTEGESGKWVASAQDYLFDVIHDLCAPAASDVELASRLAVHRTMAGVG